MTAVGITLHFLRLRSSVIIKSPPDQLTILLPLNLPLKLIPARSGYFIMGDQETGPERLVQITQPFYIGKYPITQVQWQVVMLDDHKSRFSGDQRPMEMVSWNDIMEGNKDASGAPAFLTRLNIILSIERADLFSTHRFDLTTSLLHVIGY